jgi:hypothetical protein
MKRKRSRGKRAERAVAVITGLKMGDASVLAHQALLLANLACELGRVDRRTFLAEAARTIPTQQAIGRLFSFHKALLVRKKFIKFEKVPKSRWERELKRRLKTPFRPAEEPSVWLGEVVPAPEASASGDAQQAPDACAPVPPSPAPQQSLSA